MKFLFKRYYNYAVDFLMAYSFIAINISGFILWFILPMGQGSRIADYCYKTFKTGLGPTGNAWTAFELPRYIWVELHSWISVIAIGIILLHIILHWQWIVKTLKRVKDKILTGPKAVLELYTVNLMLLLMVCIEIISGIVLWLILPRGVGDFVNMKNDLGRAFWGLQRNDWQDIHAWVSVAIAAFIIIHLIINWRWIVSVTIGKIRGKQSNETLVRENEGYSRKSSRSLLKTNDEYRRGVFLGLAGTVGFLTLIAIYQLDWVGRYSSMLTLVPLPFIGLMLARKWPVVAGTFLIILSIAVVILRELFVIGAASRVIGLDIIYTLLFVTLPLFAAGVIFIMSAVKKYKKYRCNIEL
ncbi:MAG: DUF4405 domain-containing protein [Dehalococcoidales bacterium]|jgi:hypothetical protein